MTAFANSEAEIENLIINCELRSVNHRYCDISIKLPENLRYIEASLRSLIASQLKRGKIECSLRYKQQSGNKHKIIINEGAVKDLLQATAKIEEHMHGQKFFSAMDVLNFPGVQQEPETNKDILSSAVIHLVEEALKQLLDTREQEGSQLTLLIKQRCQNILALVESANKRLPEALEEIRTKIKIKLSELNVDPDFDRLEQEMVYFVQKLDISEELDRLNTHAKEVLNVLNKDEAVGRRLDFLMQEMNREANTLGSKSADKQMTQISIDLKVLIEQMREQIQNIE